MNVFSVSHQLFWLSLSTVALLALGTPPQRFLLDFSHQSFWLCLSTIVNLFQQSHLMVLRNGNIPLITRYSELTTLNIFWISWALFFLFLFLLSHVSSNNSMMSLSTRCVRTGGMTFSLFSACGLIPTYLKYSWRGVSTIRASISCWMAMCTSTPFHCSNLEV